MKPRVKYFLEEFNGGKCKPPSSAPLWGDNYEILYGNLDFLLQIQILNKKK